MNVENHSFEITTAVNCFTSGLVYAINANSNAAIKESDLLVFGSGFQFRSDYDEYGFPEIIFDVIQTSVDAVARLGARLNKDYVDTNGGWLEQLLGLMKARGQIIVWVNSTHMKYSDVYFKRSPYLHAIVLKSFSVEKQEFSLFDSLIIDRQRKSTHATISVSDLEKALFDQIQGNELAPEMGTVFSCSDLDQLKIPQNINADIIRQIKANRTVAMHKDAVRLYREYCMPFVLDAQKNRVEASKRLYDHIFTLFIVPSFFHLRTAMNDCGFPSKAIDELDALEQVWRELGILALKFERTEMDILIPRISKKFQLIEERTDAFWLSLEKASEIENVS
ncbi:MAG: hypothetical protein ACSHXB_05325 [Sulfitobacter sp.]